MPASSQATAHDAALGLIDALHAPQEQRSQLRAVVEAADPIAGLRATYVQPLHALMAAQDSIIAQAYAAARDRFPVVAPYSFVPLGQLVALLAFSATRLYPLEPLSEGTNNVFSDYVARMRHHPNTRQVIVASGGDLFRYLEVVTESSSLWYNFGERGISRLGPAHMQLRYADYNAQLATYWVPGLNSGLLRMFEQSGDVELEPIDARHFNLHVHLETLD